MGKKQKNNSAYNGAPTDKKETVHKNDTNDEYVYENGQPWNMESQERKMPNSDIG